MILNIVFYIFATSTIILILYWLRYLFYLLKVKPGQNNGVNPAVSVVICAQNEEENIKKLLPVLYEQKYHEFEVIIVDDRSHDKTYDYLIEEREKRNNLKVVKVDEIPQHVNGKKYGLTLGIKAAKYDVVVLTDADCYPETDLWLEQMVSSYDEKTQFVLGYSKYKKKKGLLNTFIRFETLFTGIQYISNAFAGKPYMGVGRNLSYKRSFFLEVKGFRHLKVTGGDDDLIVNAYADKKNTKVSVGNGAVVISEPKTKWKEFIRQKRRHLSVGKYYKKWDRIRIGVYALSIILHWITFIPLILIPYELYFVLGGYLLKITVLYVLMIVGSKKLNDNIEFGLLPFLDLMYMFYFVWGGFVSFSRKKIKWS